MIRYLILIACGCAARTTPHPACAAPEARTFDFLLGRWHATERDASGAVVSTGSIANEPILGGCALRESWRFEIAGKPAFEAVVLRSYDSGGKRWMLSYIDDGLAHQLYEGREDAGQWRFFRERKADDGSTVLVRITWVPSAAGYTQTIERSTDAGATWLLGSTIAYDRR